MHVGVRESRRERGSMGVENDLMAANGSPGKIGTASGDGERRDKLHAENRQSRSQFGL